MKYLLEERGLPADRLAVGIPLYGRGFAVAEPYASTKDAPKTRVPGGNYSNIHQLEHEQGWTRIWDDETKNPWLISPDHKIVIGYDDAESVALKTEWAMKQGFRGVFFWQIAADLMPDDTNPSRKPPARNSTKAAAASSEAPPKNQSGIPPHNKPRRQQGRKVVSPDQQRATADHSSESYVASQRWICHVIGRSQSALR